jgi:hypothetical protein
MEKDNNIKPERTNILHNVNCCQSRQPCYMSQWYDEERCAVCETELTWEEKRLKNCPYCKSTISDWSKLTYSPITQHPYRYVRYGYWWQFWKKSEKQYQY